MMLDDVRECQRFDDIRLMVDDARLTASHILSLYNPLSRIFFQQSSLVSEEGICGKVESRDYVDLAKSQTLFFFKQLNGS